MVFFSVSAVWSLSALSVCPVSACVRCVQKNKNKSLLHTIYSMLLSYYLKVLLILVLKLLLAATLLLPLELTLATRPSYDTRTTCSNKSEITSFVQRGLSKGTEIL